MATEQMYQIAEKRLAEVATEREELSATLARLEREAVELEGFIAVWHRLSGSPKASVGADPQNPLARHGLELRDAVVTLLRMHGKPLTARPIAEKLLAMGFPYEHGVDTLYDSVRAVLSKATRDDDAEFHKIKRGVYGLAEWSDRTRNDAAPNSGVTEPGADIFNSSHEGG